MTQVGMSSLLPLDIGKISFLILRETTLTRLMLAGELALSPSNYPKTAFARSEPSLTLRS
jgi:hypothetical protein